MDLGEDDEPIEGSDESANAVAPLIPNVALHLEDESEDARREAAENLWKLSDVARPEDIFKAVAPRLEHERSEVRQAAMCAIGNLAEKGDVSAVAAAVLRAADPCPHVRKASARALNAVPKSGPETISAVAALLKDSKWQVRGAAVFALGRLADTGDTSTTDAIAGCLGDTQSEVRFVSVQALSRLAEKGERSALAAIVRAAGDDKPDVREPATKVLRGLKDGADKHTISAVAKCLQDGKWQVRFAALFALGKLAKTGDAQAATLASAARATLSDDHWQVRHAALEVIHQFAEPGNKAMATSVAERLGDEEAKVQIRALRLITALAERGCKEVLAVILPLAKDSRWAVRMCALRALRVLALAGDRAALAAAAACVKDCTWGVRSDAVRALQELLEGADGGAADAVREDVQQHLTGESLQVRLTAAWALWMLAESGFGSRLGTVVAGAAALCLLVALLLPASSGNATTVPLKPSDGGAMWMMAARFGAAWLLSRLFAKYTGTSMSPTGIAAALIGGLAA
eukprot:CAMPEP_0168417928 /NCGR_PEP_ID=MMETSP0228-20121227/31504_1 /TAXON_ID=133427 /ORGANISM="Protoceratium reticulatum, Strain CCCM 535 (=CCMP 1889)" /LENGTH=517 /DNA_ID=CAMNT_0008431791 /DNA_START=46 /DNA_END=1595 /DNA_ORIENTATION=+